MNATENRKMKLQQRDSFGICARVHHSTESVQKVDRQIDAYRSWPSVFCSGVTCDLENQSTPAEILRVFSGRVNSIRYNVLTCDEPKINLIVWTVDTSKWTSCGSCVELSKREEGVKERERDWRGEAWKIMRATWILCSSCRCIRNSPLAVSRGVECVFFPADVNPD